MAGIKLILCQLLLQALAMALSASASSIYYIKPTSNTTCPQDPCLTLSEYAQGTGMDASSDTILIFLPGYHFTATPMIVSHATNFSMRGDSTAVIICSSLAFFQFSNVTEVDISGLSFAYCDNSQFGYGALDAESVVVLRLTNTSLQSSQYTSALVAINVDNLYITSCSFSDNTAVNGAGLLMRNTVANVTGSLFSNNAAQETGGGILAWNSTLYLNGTNAFLGNVAFIGGGGIAVESSSILYMEGNTEFVGNKADIGGGMSAIGSTVTCSGTTSFIGNEVWASGKLLYGGAVFAYATDVLFGGNTSFLYNIARDGGGVFSSISHLNFDGYTLFMNNSAYSNEAVPPTNTTSSGGAIAGTFSSFLIFGGVTVLEGNWATWSGGGLFVSDNTYVYFTGDEQVFRSNSAGQDGGGLSLENSTLYSNSTAAFQGNIAWYGYGGGMSAVDSSISYVNVTEFTLNTAMQGSGGGLAVLTGTLNFGGHSLFSNNSAFLSGGGVLTASCSLVIAGVSTFESNLARKGGGLFSYLSSIHFIGEHTIAKNTAIGHFGDVYGGGLYAEFSTLSSSQESLLVFHENTAEKDIRQEGPSSSSLIMSPGVGGAMFATDTTVIFEGDIVVDSNSAASGGGLAMIFCIAIFGINGDRKHFTVLGNVASSGGGIYTSGSKMLMLASTRIQMNAAVDDGGGVFGYDGSELSFQGRENLISNNIANRGGGIFLSWNTLEALVVFNGTNTLANNTAFIEGGAIAVRDGTCVLAGTTVFINNSAGEFGGALSVITEKLLSADIRSIVSLVGTTLFIENQADEYGGGALFMNSGILNCDGHTTFKGNRAIFGGVILAITAERYPLQNIIKFDGETSCYNNSAESAGGAIYCADCNLTSSGSISFSENVAGGEATVNSGLGGAVYLATQNSESSAIFMGTSLFHRNSALHDGLGGALYVVNTTLSLEGNSKFTENSAGAGSALYTYFYSNISFSGTSALLDNVATNGTVSSIGFSTLNFEGNTTFVGNTGCGVYLLEAELALRGKSLFTGFRFTRSALPDRKGGVIAHRSNISSVGQTTFSLIDDGSGVQGHGHSNIIIEGNTLFAEIQKGALILGSGTLSLRGKTTFHNNTAIKNGGGLLVIRSDVTLDGETTFTENTAKGKGGGVYAASSTLRLLGETVFANNSAKRGGGLSLTYSSSLYTVGDITIHFIENKATWGAAIHITDATSTAVCSKDLFDLESSNAGECFFQTFVPGGFALSPQAVQPVFYESTADLFLSAQPNVSLIFQNNFAAKNGSVLYGGSLDRCIFRESIPITTLPFSNDSLAVFNYLSDTTLQNDSILISSDPMRICFCKDSKPDCTYETENLSKRRGETFTISAVAVDQVSTPVPGTIRSYLPSLTGSNAYLGDGVDIQTTSQICSDLSYKVFSPDSTEEIILYADGPCRDWGISRRSINVTFLPCPAGFQLSYSECVCETRLQQFTNTCHIDDESIRISGDFWVGYHSEPPPAGLILHPHCPFDYCKTESVDVKLAHADDQCAFHHAGILCGECQEGLSLVFGSSHCERCSNAYIGLTVVFALAGVLLVALLLLFQLTVAVGTINGLIFYANVVVVNKSIFFPSEEPNVLTVFIAWVNLDLGIETCFYDGMDAYARTWLQFVFPAYVWVLVAVIIAVSHYCSGQIARILGRNPVAILSTLFLLSYAKFLRTIIASFFFTFVEYPAGSKEAVWLYDGNVEYLQGKHIALFLVSMLTLLILVLPFTNLLLLGQWFQKWSKMKVFRWANSRRLRPFLDAYHGPYEPKLRYWTGLLLVVRCVLFLTFAFNFSGDPSINLLAISSTVLGLLLLVALIQTIYRSQIIQALELSFHLNLGVLAAATHHVRLAGGNQAAVAYTSISIAFATFLGILLYHVHFQVKDSRLFKQIRSRFFHPEPAVAEPPNSAVIDHESLSGTSRHVTTTIIDFREPLFELLDTKPAGSNKQTTDT